MSEQGVFQDKTVVIIDDDPNSLDIASILLETAGANIHTAVNGKEGLAMIEQAKPALVICDLSMPIMDGWDVIKHLKENTKLKDIPVIALTAHAMAGDRESTLAAGFYHYISKPLIPNQFIGNLLKALHNHPTFGA